MKSLRKVSVGSLLLVLAAATLLAVLPGCSATSETASAQMTSGMRPEAPPTDSFGGSSDFPDSGGSGNLPNPDDLGKQLDQFASGLGDFADCAALGLAYGQLLTLVYTSKSPDAEIDNVLGKLKTSAPSDLRDDLDLVANTLKSVGGSNILEATNAFSDPDFVKANDSIITWISTQCGG